MIRLQRTNKRYANRVDVSAELEYTIPDIEKQLKADAIKSVKVPKNTLRIIFLKKQSGFDGDGFVRNVKTYIFTYNIITFKR